MAIGASCIIVSCNTDQKEIVKDSTEKPIAADTSLHYSCPFITKDSKGNIVLSYVREINDTTAFMCYSISTDNGKTFADPVVITPSGNVYPHGENLPKIIFKPNGETIAMWGASNPNPNSKYSGLVYYSQSFDEGKSWSEATALVTDTSAYDQRYFDMELMPNGEVMAIWLDNRGKKDKEGSTLFCAVTDGKSGFKSEKAIGETCCQCCRTDLFVDTKGNIHASYRDIINDSIRDMVHIVSTNGGKSFSQPVRISEDNWVINGCPHTGPTETENDKGLHFAWYTMGSGKGVFYCKSGDSGKTFSKRDTVSQNASARHPQINSLPNGNIAIVWDESVKKGEKVNARIGFQLRDPDGKILLSKFISDDDAVSEFPTIKPLDDNHAFVSYDQRKNGKQNVIYKIVAVNN